MIISRAVTKVSSTRPYSIELDGGHTVLARSIIIATGVQYRRLPIDNLAPF